MAILGVRGGFVVSLYQSSKYRPILTIFVRSMAIGGSMYVYVGGYGEEKGESEEEETPSPGAII